MNVHTAPNDLALLGADSFKAFRDVSDEAQRIRAFVCQQYSSLQGKAILDIGSGDGSLLRGSDLYSRNFVTYIEKDVSLSHLYSADERLISGDFITSPPVGKFDLVLCIHVLESAKGSNLDRFVENVAKVSSPNGELLAVINDPRSSLYSLLTSIQPLHQKSFLNRDAKIISCIRRHFKHVRKLRLSINVSTASVESFAAVIGFHAEFPIELDRKKNAVQKEFLNCNGRIKSELVLITATN